MPATLAGGYNARRRAWSSVARSVLFALTLPLASCIGTVESSDSAGGGASTAGDVASGGGETASGGGTASGGDTTRGGDTVTGGADTVTGGDDTTTGGDDTASSGGDTTGGGTNPLDVGPRPPGPPVCTAGEVGCLYASPGGTGDACSQAAPCQIQEALSQMGAGDTLVLADGVYDQRYTLNGFTAVINLNKYFDFSPAPTAQAPVTITAAEGAKPIIDGAGDGWCALVDGEDHIVIEGLDVRNCGCAGIRVGYDVAPADITVRHCDFSNIQCGDNMGGVYIHGGTSVLVEDNTFHDFDYGDGTNQGLGLVVFGAVDLTVQYNRFYNLSEAMYYKHGEGTAGGGGVTNIHNNHFDGCRLATNQNRSDIRNNLFTQAGIQMHNEDGTQADFTHDVVIANNTFTDGSIGLNRGGTFSGAMGATIDNNVIVGALHIWTYGSDAAFNAGIGLMSTDNCVHNDAGAFEFDYFSSANPVFEGENTGGIYSLAEWQALGFGNGTIEADPQFVDAGSGDYRLADGSPCAGHGAQ